MTAIENYIDSSAEQRRRLTLRFILFSLASVVGLALAPTPASAGGKLHIDLPGISIGVHDDHYYGKKKRYRKVYKNDHYYNGHRKYKRKKYHKRYRNDYYYGNRYYDDYYYEKPRRYYQRRQYRERRAPICPAAGYSPYYNDNLSCYRHKDHFHCS